MMNKPRSSKKNSYLILFLLILVVVGPFLFAWTLYQKGQTHHFRTTNHGDLLSPPPSFSDLSITDLSSKELLNSNALLGKWWLLYVGPPKCYQECQNILYNMRQIHSALNKNTNRVKRMFIPHPDCPVNVCEQYLDEFYPDVLRVGVSQPAFSALFENSGFSPDTEIVGDLYIIDPNGNIMMHYAPNQEPKDILTDLKKLLRISKIG